MLNFAGGIHVGGSVSGNRTVLPPPSPWPIQLHLALEKNNPTSSEFTPVAQSELLQQPVTPIQKLGSLISNATKTCLCNPVTTAGLSLLAAVESYFISNVVPTEGLTKVLLSPFVLSAPLLVYLFRNADKALGLRPRS